MVFVIYSYINIYMMYIRQYIYIQYDYIHIYIYREREREREYFTKLPFKNLKAILSSPAMKKQACRLVCCPLLYTSLQWAADSSMTGTRQQGNRLTNPSPSIPPPHQLLADEYFSWVPID